VGGFQCCLLRGQTDVPVEELLDVLSLYVCFFVSCVPIEEGLHLVDGGVDDVLVPHLRPPLQRLEVIFCLLDDLFTALLRLLVILWGEVAEIVGTRLPELGFGESLVLQVVYKPFPLRLAHRLVVLRRVEYRQH